MKKLILIPFLALVGCANNDTVQAVTESDPVFSFREEEFNDIKEMSNVIFPGDLTQYQVIGELTYGDIDFITHILPSDEGNTIHVTLDISYDDGIFGAIFAKNEDGQEEMIWTRLVRGTEEVYFTLPEGCTWWDLRLAGSSIHIEDYIWICEVEVL